jgi:molybdenum cofactor guanylyltransferase
MAAVTPTVKTIVLAGGMSRRMGQDKARIEIAGVPLLTHICCVALSVSDQVCVVAGANRDYTGIVPDASEGVVDYVIDRILEGPLVALQQVFVLQPQSECEQEWILVLACDLPNLSETVVKAWVSRLDGLPDGTIAYLPKSEKGWEPLCGFYHRRAIALLHQFVESGGRSFQRWLAQDLILPFVQELEWQDQHVFFNCNTPEDLDLAASPKRCVSQS